ncbi:MAG: hypothetical protein WBA41_23475 [Rivularia sp. (in: cyanobacteria)]
MSKLTCLRECEHPDGFVFRFVNMPSGLEFAAYDIFSVFFPQYKNFREFSECIAFGEYQERCVYVDGKSTRLTTLRATTIHRLLKSSPVQFAREFMAWVRKSAIKPNFIK